MNAEDQKETAVAPDSAPEDVFEFGDRTIFTLRHQELQLDDAGALSRQTIAAPMPPPGGDETMVMVGAASASLGFPSVAPAAPMLTPLTDPGDRTIVADPSLLPTGSIAPVEIVGNEAALGTSTEERLERLEQKLDTAMRLMQTMQHRLDSMDAALARIIHR